LLMFLLNCFICLLVFGVDLLCIYDLVDFYDC